MKVIAAAVCLLVWCGAGSGATRVALVGAAGAGAVLELAEAGLSENKGVELLERRQVERVLAEQALTLSGLVDANKVVAVGKLLSVELFAVVETTAGGKEALGLVVFDARTGVRLADVTLPGGDVKEKADAAAEAVRGAVGKHEKGAGKVRTVCVVSVRNADLPREMDSFCQSVGLVLERRLTGSPGVAVLERKRLEFVNRERNLPGNAVDKDLLASLLTLDLEIHRAGKGLGVLAVLTDGKGRRVGRVTAEARGGAAADLVEPLVKGILKEAGGLPAGAAPDRAREGERFLNEAVHEWSHRNWLVAVQAAESANALRPDDDAARPVLADYLMKYALELIDPGRMFTTYGGMAQVRVKPADLAAALGLARRALEIRAVALGQLAERTPKTLGMHRSRYFPLFFGLDYLLNKLAHTLPDAFDAEVKTQLGLFRAAAVNVVTGELDAWADVAARDPDAFTAYTDELHRYARQRLMLTTDAAAYARLHVDMARRWLAVSRGQGVPFRAWVLNWFLDELIHNALTPYEPAYKAGPADFEKMGVVFDQMAGHRNPLVALYGRYGRLEAAWRAGMLTAAEAVEEFREVRQAAYGVIQGPNLAAAAKPEDDLRAGCYKFLFFALGRVPFPKYEERLAEYFALCDFMLTRKEVVRDVVVRVVQMTSYPPNKYAERGWKLAQRALAVSDASDARLREGHMGAMKEELRRATAPILKAHPELVPRQAAPPWDAERLLLRAERVEGVQALLAPTVAGADVYVVGFGSDKQGKFLQLIRVPLAGGSPVPLGKGRGKFGPVPAGAARTWPVAAAVMGQGEFYVGTGSDGVFAFPLNGDAGRRLTEGLGLPSEDVRSLAWLDGKLYAGLGGGYLVGLEPGAGRFEVLASSRRKERGSPFDDRDEFSVPFLVADPGRHRLLFLLYQGPNYVYYSAGTVKGMTSGWWEYDPKAGAFRRRLELFWTSISWVSPVRGGQVLLSGQSNALFYDLAADKARAAWSSYPAGPELPKEAAASRQDYFPVGAPRWRRGDWLWTAGPFGRISVAANRQEVFPRPGGGKAGEEFQPHWLEPVGKGDEIAVADLREVWVLHLRKES